MAGTGIDIWTLISYGLWVAFYGGVACVIAAIVAKVLGKEYAAKLFASGLAAIAVSVLGWLAFFGEKGLAEGVPIPADHGWIYLALTGGLLAVSGIYFALGRMEEGGKHLLFAIVVVGAMAFAVGLGGGGLASGGQLTVRLELPKNTYNSGEQVNLTIVIPNIVNPTAVNIDWGDGWRQTESIYPPRKNITVSHTYDVGDEAAQAFTIRVVAVDILNTSRTGFNTVSVIVQNPGWCPYPWYLKFMCGLVQGVRVILPGLDLVKLVTSPEFPVRDKDPVYEVYKAVLAASMTALGLYLGIGLAFGAFEGRIIEVFKDSVFALALALLIPHIYNASIGVLNYIALSDLPWIDPLLPAMTIVAVGVASGYFVPALAQVASALILVLILLSAIVVMRYILILAIIAAFPLIAVASIHPLFRGVMKHSLTLLAGLVMAGPITAVFLKILNVVTPGGGVTIAFLYPIVGGILPNILSIFGAGIATHLGGALMERIRGLTGKAIGATIQQQQPRAGQTTRVPTPSMSTARVTQSSAGAGQTPAARPAPIVGWSKLKTAWREAQLRKRVAESIAETQRLPIREFFAMAEAEKEIPPEYRDKGLLKASPQLRYIAEATKEQKTAEALAKVAEERAREPTVHPRIEALKAFTRSLATQSWRQLRTNARTMARELGHALAQELGVKIRATSGSARIGLAHKEKELAKVKKIRTATL